MSIQDKVNPTHHSKSSGGIIVLVGFSLFLFMAWLFKSFELGVILLTLGSVVFEAVRRNKHRLTRFLPYQKEQLNVYSKRDPEETTIKLDKKPEPASKVVPAQKNYNYDHLPAIVPYDSVLANMPESKTAFAFGVSATGETIYGDLQGDNLHIGVWGNTGGGKDSFLRNVFYTLTKKNTPDELIFAFIDAKGDWLVPSLEDRAHMFINPAGGVGEAGIENLKNGIKAITSEMGRRFKLVQSHNCRTREAYIEKTGEKLPLLVVVFTDITKAIENEVDLLLTDLVAKGRAAGIRVIVSTQTPGNMSMSWRSNISTNMSFHQSDSSQDAVCLGSRQTSNLPIKPSDIPSSKAARGVFVMRSANGIDLVRGTFIDEAQFDQYVEHLPKRGFRVVIEEETLEEQERRDRRTPSPEEVEFVLSILTKEPNTSDRELARQLYVKRYGSLNTPEGGVYDGSGDIWYKARNARLLCENELNGLPFR